MMVKIEKSIPLAGRPASQNKKPNYPYGEMEIGDSFFVAGDIESKRAVIGAYGYSSRHAGFKFAARAESGGLRIWRVEDPRTSQNAALSVLNNLIQQPVHRAKK